MIIIDADGAERDWEWVKRKYNLPEIVEASKNEDHWEVAELHESIGPSSMTVRLIGDEDEISGTLIIFGWPDGSSTQFTNAEGHTGFGMGGGAYYHPETGYGPHCVFVDIGRNSDMVKGLGMIAGTNHAHLEPTFQFVLGGEEAEEGRTSRLNLRER